MKVLQERAAERRGVRGSSIYVLSPDNLSQFRQKFEPKYIHFNTNGVRNMFDNPSNDYIMRILSANKDNEVLELERVKDMLYQYVSSFNY